MIYRRLHLGPLAALACSVLCSAQVSLAQNQTSASGRLNVVPTRDPGASLSLDGFRLTAPIRLSLSGNLAPLASQFPQCQTLEDDVGNSLAHIPVHHYAEWQPVARLRLSGFSQLGCPIDAGLGVVMLYSIPVHDSTSLVFASGLYGAPAQFDLFGGLGASLRRGLRGVAAPITSDAGVDLMWQTKDGSAYGVGAESVGAASSRLRFTGAF